MKANELRIGNWVNVEHPSELEKGILYELQVLGIDSYNVIETHAYGHVYGTCDAGMDRVHAIPITEEWLLKIGFEKPDNLGLWVYVFSNTLAHWFYYNLTDSFFEIDGMQIPCNEVHHIQNLYFALNGEELILRK